MTSAFWVHEAEFSDFDTHWLRIPKTAPVKQLVFLFSVVNISLECTRAHEKLDEVRLGARKFSLSRVPKRSKQSI